MAFQKPSAGTLAGSGLGGPLPGMLYGEMTKKAAPQMQGYDPGNVGNLKGPQRVELDSGTANRMQRLQDEASDVEGIRSRQLGDVEAVGGHLAEGTGEGLMRSDAALGGQGDPSVMKALANRAKKSYGFEVNKLQRKASLDAPLQAAKRAESLQGLASQSQGIRAGQDEQALQAGQQAAQMRDQNTLLQRKNKQAQDQYDQQKKAMRAQAIGNILGAVGTGAGAAFGGGSGAAVGGQMGQMAGQQAAKG